MGARTVSLGSERNVVVIAITLIVIEMCLMTVFAVRNPDHAWLMNFVPLDLTLFAGVAVFVLAKRAGGYRHLRIAPSTYWRPIVVGAAALSLLLGRTHLTLILPAFEVALIIALIAFARRSTDGWEHARRQ